MSAITNTDPFVEAVYEAQEANGSLTHFVVSPATAKSLSLLKDQVDSARNLLEFQQDGTILVAGVELVVSSLVDAGTVGWGLDSRLARLVLKEGTHVIKTYVPQNDSYFISGVSRWGWGHLRPGVVQRVRYTPLTFTVTVTGGPEGGTFTMSVNGTATGTIAYNASAATVKSAIVAVDDSIVADDVTVTGSNGGPFTVTLPGVLTVGSAAGLTGGTDPGVTVS